MAQKDAFLYQMRYFCSSVSPAIAGIVIPCKKPPLLNFSYVCLGKMIVFTIQWRNRGVFRTLIRSSTESTTTPSKFSTNAGFSLMTFIASAGDLTSLNSCIASSF